jgi:hypothetical protein
MTQKTAIDAELKTLQEQVEKESAALKKPRQPREKAAPAVVKNV